jgi:drug/metabolite transporter (DMT)-like permease
MVYVLVLTAVTAVFGWTFVVVKDAVAQYPVAPFLALRFVIALVVLLLVTRRMPQRRSLLVGGVLGVVVAAGYALQTYGLQQTAPGTAGLITGLFVVFTPLIERIGFGGRVARRTWTAVATALAGTALLTAGGGGSLLTTGVLLLLASSVCWAVQIVLLSRRGPGLRPTDLAVLQVGVCAVAFTGAGSTTFAAPSTSAWLALAITGVLASALAFPLQAWAQARISATRAALVLATEPAWALLFAVVLAGQRLHPLQVLGVVLVLAAVLGHEAAPALVRTAGGRPPARGRWRGRAGPR